MEDLKIFGELICLLLFAWLFDRRLRHLRFKKFQRLFEERGEELVAEGELGPYTQTVLRFAKALKALPPRQQVLVDLDKVYQDFIDEVGSMPIESTETANLKSRGEKKRGKLLGFGRRFRGIYPARLKKAG